MVAYFNLNNLNGKNGFVINNSRSSDFGFPVKPGGDVTGDGIDDLLIGAPGTDGLIGEAYVLYGNKNGFPAMFNETFFDGINGAVIEGSYWPAFDFGHGKWQDKNHGIFGNSLASAGDFNGDGINDILVGAPVASPDQVNGAGAAYLIYGQPNFPATLNVTNLNGENGFMMKNAVSCNGVGYGLGYSISSAGDIDKDGLSDILVGANTNVNGPFSGEIFLIYGTKNSFPASINLYEVSGVSFNGARGSNLAQTVAAAGDVDGDGFDDILMGADLYSQSSWDVMIGKTYLFYGTDKYISNSIDVDLLGSENGTQIIGVNAYDSTSFPLAGLGDINNDGFADFATVTVREGKNQPGEVYVIYGGNNLPASISLGNLSNIGFTIPGLRNGDTFGYAICGLGDVNDDKIDDFIVTAPFAFGSSPLSPAGISQAYIIYGNENRFSGNFDLNGLDGTNGFVVNATAIGNRFSSACSAGDINADGVNDIAIGGDGLVYVIYGGANIALGGEDNNQDII